MLRSFHISASGNLFLLFSLILFLTPLPSAHAIPRAAMAAHLYHDGERLVRAHMDDEAGLKRGFEMLLSAAKSGHPQAAALVGRLYLDGRGTPPDLVQAYRWLTPQAKRGNMSAVFDMARLSNMEGGAWHNPREAERLFNIALRYRDPRACFVASGQFFRSHEDDTALAYLRCAAQGGYEPAMLAMVDYEVSRGGDGENYAALSPFAKRLLLKAAARDTS